VVVLVVARAVKAAIRTQATLKATPMPRQLKTPTHKAIMAVARAADKADSKAKVAARDSKRRDTV